jgi:tetratricopeptide (TPR) repeat protein
MILYRPVGLQEMELVYDSGMQSFPARLPKQPIFYPVLQVEYARQIASDWNAKSGASAGYVTQFKVEDSYIGQFEKHTVGHSQHQEFWIPAEELEEFNKHLVGHIKVLEAHFGKAFQGFVPQQFALQGKNAVEQFTLLANSYLYKRMDFYLEIKRNHKAIFLNYPFWQGYDFKNPGLKEKIIKAIREAWLTSFPKIPLVAPPPDEVSPENETDQEAPVYPLEEDPKPIRPTAPRSVVRTVREEAGPAKPSYSQSLVRPPEKKITPAKRTDSPSFVRPGREDRTSAKPINLPTPIDPLDDKNDTFAEQTNAPSPDEDDTFRKPADSHFPVNTAQEKIPPVRNTDVRPVEKPVEEDLLPPRQAASHFSQGLVLGLSGKYAEAADELSKAVEEDPDHIVAQTSLGVALHHLGKDELALSCYDAALQIDPQYAEAHYFRANLLYSHGNVREAIAGYTAAIGLEPELIESHEKPVPQDRLTDYTSSPTEIYRIVKPARRILDLNKALETHPRPTDLLKERAAEYYRLWNYEQAIADCNASLTIQPDDARALHLRGLAYEQVGQSERAREDLQQAAALNPQISDVHFKRGVAFGQSGNFQQSVTSLTEGLRLAPENVDAYFNRGTSYFQLGDLENAIQDFSTVIRLIPNDEAAYYWRGISHEAAGRPPQAIADYQQFLDLSRDEDAKREIEQRLSQWKQAVSKEEQNRGSVREDRQKLAQAGSGKQGQRSDFYRLVAAFGDRSLRSTWFGGGVDCNGETADQLYALTAQNLPIEGDDFLRLAAGIRQIMAGDFQAFDPGEDSPWVFLRTWEGNGFYVETDDPQVEKQLKVHYQAVEEVEGASPPYQGFFIRI